MLRNMEGYQKLIENRQHLSITKTTNCNVDDEKISCQYLVDVANFTASDLDLFVDCLEIIARHHIEKRRRKQELLADREPSVMKPQIRTLGDSVLQSQTEAIFTNSLYERIQDSSGDTSDTSCIYDTPYATIPNIVLSTEDEDYAEPLQIAEATEESTESGVFLPNISKFNNDSTIDEKTFKESFYKEAIRNTTLRLSSKFRSFRRSFKKLLKKRQKMRNEDTSAPVYYNLCPNSTEIYAEHESGEWI